VTVQDAGEMAGAAHPPVVALAGGGSFRDLKDVGHDSIDAYGRPQRFFGKPLIVPDLGRISSPKKLGISARFSAQAGRADELPALAGGQG
jgi:hypothetical protein